MADVSGRFSSTSERRRGQTETLGVVLLLGITVIGAMSVVAFGATALDDARDTSGYESVSHAMTQLDSRAAMVGLGGANSQSLQLGRGNGGTYTVEPEAGWMNVTHVNESDVEPFANVSLGALVYRADDVEIAYQGGGVWRKQGGGSTMVSPPEFHYRDATLTLPIIGVNGSDSASGNVRASLANEVTARPVFPNASSRYNNGEHWHDEMRYQNPVSDGNVTVTVQSEYYEAWGEYFRARSDGEVSVHHSNETVELILLTPNTLGDFNPMPGEGSSISVQQLGEGHPVNAFNITLTAENTASENLDMDWRFRTDGVQEFEIRFSGQACHQSGNTDKTGLDISIYYYNGTGGYEGWKTSIDDIEANSDIETSCSSGEVMIDLLGNSTLEYGEVDETSGRNLDTETEFDQHSTDNESKTYRDGTGEELGFLVNHYLQLLGPTVDLMVTDTDAGGVHQIDEGASFGHLDYDQGGGPRYITFLHVTENRVNVELD